MRVKDLEELFDYSYWANNKLFEVVVKLTPEGFGPREGVAGTTTSKTLSPHYQPESLP